MRWWTDRGSVSAEFAVALPAVVLTVAVCAGALAAGAGQVRLQDAVADAARLLARGEDQARAARGLTLAVPAARMQIDAAGDLVCVSASAPSALPGISLRARSCALEGGL